MANGFVYPELDLARPVECSFEWRLPAGWALATSFGATVSRGKPLRQKYRGPWNDLQNSMFAAGDFRLHRANAGRGQVLIAIRGRFGFPDTDAVNRIGTLIRLERDFWRDHRFPYFLVTLAPFGPGESSSGGSGFTNAFNLYAPAEGSFSTGLLSLLAHETFHTWNPLRMGRIRMPEERTNWFTEGFTTYYQDLLLWRAGLLTDAQYLEAVNRIIRDYHFSPARNATLAELVGRAPADQAKGRIPYERGAMIALWIDDAIRRRSNGRVTLDAAMQALLAERRRQPDLSKERILAALARYVDAPVAEQLRRYVEVGTTVEAPASLRLACARREAVELRAFELGMDRTALMETGRVRSLVPGSEAERAGLREGDMVKGMSIHWNDTAKPVLLTLAGGRRIRYLPLGPSLGRVPRYACP